MNTKAKAMLVEGRCLRPPAKPPHRAEAQRDIPGPKTILVSQQLPRRTKQRPFGGTRKKICGAHLKSQGPLRPLQQGVQLPFAIQPAVKLTPQSQKSCPRSSALNRTTYLFTEISFAAMIASVVPTVDESESSNPFNLVEAGD